MDKIKEPEKMIEWIRKNWSSLKKKDQLREAINRWMKNGGYDGILPADDIIFIEEQFPEYLT